MEEKWERGMVRVERKKKKGYGKRGLNLPNGKKGRESERGGKEEKKQEVYVWTEERGKR